MAQTFTLKHLHKFSKSILVNNAIVKYTDIYVFQTSNRNNNDHYNKKRETIILSIINKQIPDEFYKYSKKWNHLKCGIKNYIEKICKIKNIDVIENIYCIQKAGRNNNYDFILYVNNNPIYIEFKYGATTANETPQFVSPMKPSQYLSSNFEYYSYYNCLWHISEKSGISMPDYETYMNKIHSNKVECMKEFKERYDKDKTFNKMCKYYDKQCIKNFIHNNDLLFQKLSDYLVNSQKDKNYMCYKDGTFYYDKIDETMYKIKRVIERTNTSYICETESLIKLEVRLRFKNGCGLQFPAFQIKRKIPFVKELQQICRNNYLTPPKLKKDICKLLDENKIVY